MTPRETVEELYRLYGTGEIEAVIDMATDDVTYIAFGDPASDVFAGRFHGKEALRERFLETARLFDFRRFEPVDFISEGDRVAARVLCEAAGKPSGEKIATELAHFWTIRDGKWTEVIEYFDTARVGGAVAACR